MDEILNKIIVKVRQMYQYDMLLREITNSNAVIRLVEKDGTIRLNYVTFGCKSGDITVTEEKVTYTSAEGSQRTLISYETWEEFLNL